MEDLLESGSNSISSIMSLDISETNQSDEKPALEIDKTGTAGKSVERNFAQISEMRDLGEIASVTSESDWNLIKVEDDDDDLKELNCELLSKQMSTVVTQLEKHALDDFGKDCKEVLTIDEDSVGSSTGMLSKFNENKSDEAIAGVINLEQDDPSSGGTDNTDEKDSHIESEINQPFSDIQIKVIDVPDDDDLFDFLKYPSEPGQLDEPLNMSDAQDMQILEEMKQRELYRLLIDSNPPMSQSNEVTPYQSGDEDKSDSDSSDRSGPTEELMSDTDNEHEESLPQHVSYTEESESRPETPVQMEEKIETPVKVRRKPGPKPRLDKPQKKPKLTPGQLTEKTLEKLEKCKIATHKWLKDLEVPEELSLENSLRFDIVDLNPYLTCGLCKGYLYEASTITECMHTFCKNCIVRHCMEVSLHCPVCNILIHPTDPFVHIRLDRMIQDIVYKILPNVAETEMKSIKAFYKEHPEDQPKEVKEEPPELKTSPKEKEIKSPRSQPNMVSLILESENDMMEPETLESLEKKFVRVNSCASVRHVCEFLKTKLNLDDNNQVGLFCCGDAIEEETLTLEKIKAKFFGDEDCLMLLQYKVRET